MPICPKTGARVHELGALTPAGAYSIREESLEALQQGDQLLGRCLGRNFVIVHILGHGMMGTVYEGIHLQLERQCAIKVLRPDLVSNPSVRERFRREAKAIARLNHPNLVKVYDYDVEPDGTSYIAMEFVKSKMLNTLQPFSSEAGITLGVSLHILLQMLYALSEAHRHGVVHRDLKPENLAICHFPGHPYFVKVLDFGLAKLMETQGGASQLTMAGEVLGTPLYMSPEQAVAVEAITHSSDIYAFGAMAFEMLAGRPPFDAPTSLAIMMQHVQSPIPDLTPRDDISAGEALCAVITRCLQKKPEERYPTVKDVIQALEATPEVQGLRRTSKSIDVIMGGGSGADSSAGMFGRVSGWFRGK